MSDGYTPRARLGSLEERAAAKMARAEVATEWDVLGWMQVIGCGLGMPGLNEKSSGCLALYCGNGEQ